MKLLVIYPEVPYPLNRGVYQRTFHLLRELSAVHDVDLLALAEQRQGTEHRAVFETFCRRVEILPFQHPPWQKFFPERLLNPLPANIAHWTLPEIGAAIDRLLAENQYDAVHLGDIVLAQYILRRHPKMPLVVDRTRVDLQYQWMEHAHMKFPFRTRMLRYEAYLKLWWYEQDVARRSRVEIVCGPDDEKFVHRWINRHVSVAVIPNGVDTEFFFPKAADDPRVADPTLLFCGAMDYNPNIDALRWYFETMHEPLRRLIPNLQLLVVGKGPAPEVLEYARRPGVTVTGGVPDVRPYYRRAWLQIVPLRIGGGTRLKIVESMAMGTPVISTTIGAQGLDLCHKDDILLADRPEDFVHETARSLKDGSLRQSLEQRGIETVLTRFSWPTLGRELLSVYEKHFPEKTHKEKRSEQRSGGVIKPEEIREPS
jgi:polysaccharide biosynthesis protein PslH